MGKILDRLTALLIGLTTALSPLYVIRWQFWGIPTTLLEILLGLTIAVWFLGKAGRGDFSLPKTGLELPVALFLLAGMLALLTTPDLRHGLGIFKAYLVEPILFFYVISDFMGRSVSPVALRVRNHELRVTSYQLLFYSLILAGLWLSLLGIAQVLLGKLIIVEAQADRAHAVFNNGNALALFLGPIIILLCVRIRENWQTARALTYRCSAAAALVIMLTAFVLTRSTGGWIALAVALALITITTILCNITVSRKLVILGSLVYLLSQLIFFGLLPRFMPAKLKAVENPWQRLNISTQEVRLCLWEGAANLIKDRFLLGAGLSGFKELYAEKYFTCDAEPLEYPHNIVLNFWTELGLLGLVSFFWILYRVLSRFAVASLSFAIVYWLIHGLVDVPYFKNDLALEFWVIAAGVLFEARTKIQEASK